MLEPRTAEQPSGTVESPRGKGVAVTQRLIPTLPLRTSQQRAAGSRRGHFLPTQRGRSCLKSRLPRGNAHPGTAPLFPLHPPPGEAPDAAQHFFADIPTPLPPTGAQENPPRPHILRSTPQKMGPKETWGGGRERSQCLSSALCSSAHSIAMVISSKTEERSLPTAPLHAPTAAPSPASGEVKGGGGCTGPVHCTSPPEPPPVLQGQLLVSPPPHTHTHTAHPLPRCTVPGHCGAAAAPGGARSTQVPQRASSPPPLPHSLPSLQPFCSWSIPHPPRTPRLAMGGKEKFGAGGKGRGLRYSPHPPTTFLLLTRMRGK